MLHFCYKIVFKLEFGETSNEIYFDKGNVSLEEIKSVESILELSAYYGNDGQSSARLERENNAMILKLLVLAGYIDKPEIKSTLQNMHNSLEYNLETKV